MAKIQTTDSPIGGFYGESITTATTIKAVALPEDVKSVLVNCTGDWRIQKSPRVVAVFKTADGELTFTDYTTEANDKSTSTLVTLSSLSTAANGDYWYVACKKPFGGIFADVVSANGNASTMTGYYFNGVWTSLSTACSFLDKVSDGTNAIAQDGVVTWTVPSDWKPSLLSTLFPKGNLTTLPREAQDSLLYVVRFQVSAALDSSTTIASLVALGDYNSFPHGYLQADTDYTYNIDREIIGGLSYYDAAGSKTLLLTYMYEDYPQT